MSLYLSKKILREYPNGFVGGIVEGKRGVGKSAYCIKVMKEVYQKRNGCSDEEAYDIALKHLLFDLDDVIPFLQHASKQPQPVIVATWDDAGVHGSNIRWFTNMRQVEMLKALTDTIRTGLTGFLINCPDRHGLLKVLRSYDDFVITITKGSGAVSPYVSYDRVARGYNIFKLPSGTRRIYKSFEDSYSCYLPDYVYKKYSAIRRKYFEKAVQAIADMQKKLGSMNPVTTEYIEVEKDDGSE